MPVRVWRRNALDVTRRVSLRPWQREALARFEASRPENFLTVACPGAGKTTFALAAARQRMAGERLPLVIVVPTQHLKRQWAEAAVRFGFHLDPQWSPDQRRLPADMHGIVTTYAQVASAAPVQKARLATASATPAAAATPTPAKAAEATGSLETFRWPVRGRIIAAYGAKTNGKSNDGINVAVPEGTPVKAAEDGVVAYAGNELKGYGNLVLVRHSNGYVTAYAHASQLMVKRGQSIKRGQVIAKSGQTGDASSPQLHFEIRKGSTPVDPLRFLNGA